VLRLLGYKCESGEHWQPVQAWLLADQRPGAVKPDRRALANSLPAPRRVLPTLSSCWTPLARRHLKAKRRISEQTHAPCLRRPAADVSRRAARCRFRAALPTGRQRGSFSWDCWRVTHLADMTGRRRLVGSLHASQQIPAEWHWSVTAEIVMGCGYSPPSVTAKNPPPAASVLNHEAGHGAWTYDNPNAQR
jgi:hypothetical protein